MPAVEGVECSLWRTERSALLPRTHAAPTFVRSTAAFARTCVSRLCGSLSRSRWAPAIGESVSTLVPHAPGGNVRSRNRGIRVRVCFEAWQRSVAEHALCIAALNVRSIGAGNHKEDQYTSQSRRLAWRPSLEALGRPAHTDRGTKNVAVDWDKQNNSTNT